MEPADVLDPDELQDVASTFGVDENQVLRDHLISHLLAVISAEAADLYARLGPANSRPDPVDYADAPDQARWERDLGGQTRLAVTAV
jgi:hypothetical protein